MEAENARMGVQQVQADVQNPDREPEAQPAKPRPRWRGSAIWLLACVGGGCLLIAAVLIWGHWEFGSLANTLAYLNGERLLADPATLSFGAAHRGEKRELRFTIQNLTGEEVRILGARSKCGCLGMEEKFPISIASGGQRELAVHVWVTGMDSAFEKRMDFYTNNEANPVIAIAVRGTITD